MIFGLNESLAAHVQQPGLLQQPMLASRRVVSDQDVHL
jgi:hypothetical protein